MPMSRIYNVREHDGNIESYKGFDRNYFTQPIELVALVKEEDVVETYMVDNNEQARTEFARYFTQQREELGDHYVFLGFFQPFKL